MLKISKIFSSETTEQNLMKHCQKHPWYVYYKSYVQYGPQQKNIAAVTKNRRKGVKMQFCANNSKTIAFSKIFMVSKSVQHDEIYLWAYSE